VQFAMNQARLKILPPAQKHDKGSKLFCVS